MTATAERQSRTRDVAVTVKHLLDVDHPSAGTRLQKTWCGRWVRASELAEDIDTVTCGACTIAKDVWDALDI